MVEQRSSCNQKMVGGIRPGSSRVFQVADFAGTFDHALLTSRLQRTQCAVGGKEKQNVNSNNRIAKDILKKQPASSFRYSTSLPIPAPGVAIWGKLCVCFVHGFLDHPFLYITSGSFYQRGSGFSFSLGYLVFLSSKPSSIISKACNELSDCRFLIERRVLN